jgi:predicted anti-sigma-YlaC factor YlaD
MDLVRELFTCCHSHHITVATAVAVGTAVPMSQHVITATLLPLNESSDALPWRYVLAVMMCRAQVQEKW